MSIHQLSLRSKATWVDRTTTEWFHASKRRAPHTRIDPDLGLSPDIFTRFRKDKPEFIIGCDEVGRGALAGPVVVVAFMAPADWFFDGVKDSKAFKTRQKRAEMYERLACELSTARRLCAIPASSVDSWGINQASQIALEECLESLRMEYQAEFDRSLIVTDAGLCARYVDHATFPKADDIVQHVSAASIFAKVLRDDWMAAEAHKMYPYYDFDKNAGYGSHAHRAGLMQHGPSPIHRKTFLKELTNP